MEMYFVVLIVSLCAYVSAQAVTEENCEVCVKLIRRFADSLDSATKADPNKIEVAFKDYCETTTGKDERLCYYVGGLTTSATYIVNELTKPISWGMPAEKVCDKLKKLDAQVCSLKYEKQIDLSEVDFKKMRVNELKKILAGWNQECRGCTEKSEFISMIERLMPQYAPEAHSARAAKKTEL